MGSRSFALLGLVGALACEASPRPAPEPGPPAVAPEPVAPEPVASAPAVVPAPQEAAPQEAAQEPGAVRPLTPDEAAALAAVAEERNFNQPVEHYTVSNEYRHDLWFPFVRGLGGAYVGVASDQNYTLIAAARSEVAFLVDLDRQVVDLHAIYAALIEAAPDPAAFLALLADDAQRPARAALEAGLRGAAKDRARALEFYAAQRPALAEYLRRVQTQRGSWLADADAYAYVRAMFAAGRIRVLQGNLAGKTMMPSLAAGARALGLAVKVLYLSNAEEYLFYTGRYADNVGALPTAPDSVVLRTIHDRFPPWESCGEGDTRWNYQVQALTDYQQRIGARGKSRAGDRHRMLTLALAEGAVERRARGVSVVGALAGASPDPRAP